MGIGFKHFTQTHPEWKTDLGIYKRDDKVFQRVVSFYEDETTGVKHEYHSCINIKTGEVYDDSRRRAILAKHIALIFFRPIHTIIKTLWHLSILPPLILEIISVANNQQTIKDLRENTFKSLADIARTPLYGVAMTVTHVSAAILGCVRPNTLYKTREMCGKLERKLLRIEKLAYHPWIFTPCMTPGLRLGKDKMMEYATPFQRIDEMTLLLNKIIYARLEYGMKTREACNGFHRISRNKPYISKAAKGSL